MTARLDSVRALLSTNFIERGTNVAARNYRNVIHPRRREAVSTFRARAYKLGA